MERSGAGGRFGAVGDLGIISNRKLEQGLNEWGTNRGQMSSHRVPSTLHTLRPPGFRLPTLSLGSPHL